MDKATTYSFSALKTIVGGKAYGDPSPELQITALLTDSRKLAAPAQSLFFAIQTSSNDGHRFIPELLGKGVRLFVVSRMDRQWLRQYPEAGFIDVGAASGNTNSVSNGRLVDPVIRALQDLAAYHRSQFRFQVIGITGSNGKTIVKEWLFQLLNEHFHIVRNPKSYNSQIGVPLSVWQMTEKDQLGIFEAGISTTDEMQALQKIIRPDIGLFTNIGPAHDSGFASQKEKIREKLHLFAQANTLVYCADHTELHGEIIAWRRDMIQPPALFSWGRGRDADVRLVEALKSADNTELRMCFRDEEFVCTIPFSDDAAIENAMHCISIMLLLGLSSAQIKERTPALQTVAMRLELKEGINQCSLINDSYNSDLNSLAIALDFLKSQTRYERSTLIISDILQTGMTIEALYARVAAMAEARGVSRLIGIGREISSQSGQFHISSHFFPDTETFIRSFDFSQFHNEAILLKGARPFAFEKLSGLLQQKNHQTLLEVDLDALIHNLNVFRSRLDRKVRVMGMVKAFSYGSGSVEIAGMLQYHHIDYLAVAYADEGKELREGGIHVPIMVMNPELRSFDTMLRYKLEPEIYSMGLLQRFSENLKQYKEDAPVAIHIKIDTGLHRLGFLPAQTDALIAFLNGHPSIRVASVFSHMAASDDLSHDDFSRQQINTFISCCDKLESGIGHFFLRHICNSAAVNRFPEAHFDMVRLGIGLYGISHDPEMQKLLQNVSTFRSVISQIKRLPKGETIGYNRKGVAHKDMDVAIVPLGYADGLRRQLGNGNGTLIAGGQACRIIGNISMDMCAIDVSGVPVQEGDEVIIFGRERPVQELARDMSTIPYEVLTSVSQRVKRIYYQG